MNISLFALALFLGAAMSVYLPMIAQSARLMGSPTLANVAFFGVALVTSVGIAAATGNRAGDFAKIAALPLWLLSAGVMSAAMIIGTSFLVPRIGITAFFVLLVSGQVLAGTLFGYLGLFGVAPTPLTLGKLVGVALVIGGIWLVTFR